jgi:N-acetylglucosamine transport system substrate-binding protein
MHDEGVVRLIAETVAHRYSRRDVLRRAAALGLAVPAIGLALQASDAMAQTPAASGATNPLGVDPSAPLDVVIFKGGYGDDYAKYVNDKMYHKLYPDAKITYAGIQRLGEQLQPRFVNGTPPDVIDNSGAGNLDTAALVAEGQLADLAPLMKAVSYDTEGKTFADTLVPGTQSTGQFDGVQRYLNYVLSVQAIWYSSSWMKSKGYTYPKTWTEMMDLSKEIKGSGMYPWVTTGVYPQYVLGFMFDQMLWKHDPQASLDIDNLKADAWKAPAVQDVLEALYMLAENDYLLPGWEAETHIESQAEWLQGKAAFLPCGSWLENEMKDSIPQGFDMVVAPTPSLEGDKIPFDGLFAGGGEVFIVPEKGKNQKGGMEWLRLLFSIEGSNNFAQATHSLTVVQGAGEGLDLGTAFGSVQQAIKAAGTNTWQTMYGTWYKDLQEEAKNQMAALLQKQIDIKQYMDSVQKVADQVKDDDSVPKYTHEPASS